MHVTPLVWWTTIIVLAGFLVFDIAIVGRRPHVPSKREVTTSLLGYIGAALVFGLGIWWVCGGQYAGEFYAGWLTEYSLSVDNLFIFMLITASLKVPQRLQQSALLVGIVIAIVLRGAFIALGAVVIERFVAVFYLFGAFLVYTAVKLARGGDTDDDEYHESRLLGWVRRRLSITDDFHGARLSVREGGRRRFTPMLVVILALGTTDLLFALDSIPAIYGLTSEPYLVLTANIFALMGLRQLYFLIGDLLKRLVYLSYGLAVLLAFIGVKLILHALHENNLPFLNGGEPIHAVPDVPIAVSLGAIVVILGVTTVASLLKTRRDARLSGDADEPSGDAETPSGGADGRRDEADEPPRGEAVDPISR